MTKADIVRQVSENTGIDKKEVGAVIESFMENVRESLCKNENVCLLYTSRNRSLVPERYDGRLVETVALRSYGNDVIAEQFLFPVQAADYGAHVLLTGRDLSLIHI